VGRVNISFKADAKEPTDSSLELTADPPMLDFGPVEKKKRRKLESEIKNMTTEKMDISIVSAPPDFFKKVELSDDDLDPGDDTKLKIELQKGKEDELFRKSVTIEAQLVESGKKFRITLPVVKGIGGDASAKKSKN
jgi:hypothetical protein